MKFSLMPQEFEFFDLLEKEASSALEAVTCFKEAIINKRIDQSVLDKIHAIEHRGDDITHDIIDKLYRTFITPFDREDIHSLAHELDSVVDISHSIINRIVLYKIEDIKDDMIKFAELIEKATHEIVKAIKGLRTIKKQGAISDACIEIHRIENLGDQLRDSAISKLFTTCKDPVDILKWKDIFEDAEMVLDKCEDVANIVRGLMVKHA
jgi:uncharacterized protein